MCFCWHTDWTVEVQVDGGSWTPIHPVRNILDPRAVRELEYIATLGNSVRHPSLKRIVTTCSYISLPIKIGGLSMCVLLTAMATITMHLLTIVATFSKLVLP